MIEDIQSLETRRAELVKRLGAIRRDLARGLDRDTEEQAIQLENLEVLQEISRVAQQELLEVDRKLAQLKRGKGG